MARNLAALREALQGMHPRHCLKSQDGTGQRARERSQQATQLLSKPRSVATQRLPLGCAGRPQEPGERQRG